jgi:hypothetical protein
MTFSITTEIHKAGKLPAGEEVPQPRRVSV